MTCPVCRRPVKPNAGGRNIAVHQDTVGRRCPASGHPNRICEVTA